MEYNYIPRPDKNTQNANKSNFNHPYIDVNDAMDQFEVIPMRWVIDWIIRYSTFSAAKAM